MGQKPPSPQTRLSFLSEAQPTAEQARPRAASADERRVFSISQIVRGANRLLEARFTNLWIEGEVVGFKLGSTGHAYFTLKDDGAVLPVAMWRSSVERLRFSIEDGQMLRCLGRVGIFAKQGRFQFYAERAEPAGLGALMLELEQRKAKLRDDGLLDPARKRPLPAWPRRIGVVTSAKGAAIHDVLEVARRRCPSRVLLSPAPVQGPDAPFALRQALRRLYDAPEIDVIILARGGGAVEDLWAFNDEALAREVAASPVPVVSGVGHEVDVTLCDLVADVRAATPSHAAELVVPDRAAVVARLDALRRRLGRAVERTALDERSRLEALVAPLHRAGGRLTALARRRLNALQEALTRHHPRTRLRRNRDELRVLVERLAHVGRRLGKADRIRLATLDARVRRRGQALPGRARNTLHGLTGRLHAQGRALPGDARLRLVRAAGALDALSPLAVLTRGYAVVTNTDGDVVVDARDAPPGTALEVRLQHGRLQAEVTGVVRPDPPPSAGPGDHD